MPSSSASSEFHRSGTLYGAFAFASIVLTCFGGYFFTSRFYQPAEMVPWVWLLGCLYVALGILSEDYGRLFPRAQRVAYYATQLVILTALVFLSPARGFFGMIVLPVASQAVFDLRPRWAAAVGAYLFLVTIGVWGLDFGWEAAFQASMNYAAGFAFTIAFTLITKRALDAREQSEALSGELAEANAQLRAHAAQAEELATTRERNRLAREIHDGVGHHLTVVKTELDVAAATCERDPAGAKARVEKAARLVAEALDDVRRSVGSLRADRARPPLVEAVRQLAAHGEPAATVSVEGVPRPLDPAAEHALFRAAQEGLTNVRKHAAATTALLRIDFRPADRVRLEVSDNGRGASGDGRGFGLTGIRERVELLGGSVESGNRLEGGFALRVEVPS